MNDNPVAPGTAVYFYTEEGVVTGAAVTNEYGMATATWFSADPRNDGQVEVFATTEGATGLVADTTHFYMSGPPAAIPTVTTFDASIDADGASSTTITATVEDVNGNPVADGLYALNFVTTKGSISGSPSTISYTCGDVTAQADATITSQICASDVFAASYDVVQADITAYSGLLTGSTSMTFLNGDPSTDNSSIAGPEQVGLSSTIPILVTVKDQWGNPIAGIDVTFSASAGTIPAGPIASNALGYVTTSYTSHSVEESVTISATLDGGAVVYYTVSVVAPAKGNGPVAPQYEVNDWQLFENFEKLGSDEQKELLKRMQLLPVEDIETQQAER
mgnify:CR=1 FL=1